MLTDRGRLQDPTLSRLPSGQELVLTDARARTGGPTPTHRAHALALRQRILSEAALEVAKGDEPTRPIVVTLPYGWNPGVNWRAGRLLRRTADPVGAVGPDATRPDLDVRRTARLRTCPARRRDRRRQRRGHADPAHAPARCSAHLLANDERA